MDIYIYIHTHIIFIDHVIVLILLLFIVIYKLVLSLIKINLLSDFKAKFKWYRDDVYYYICGHAVFP